MVPVLFQRPEEVRFPLFDHVVQASVPGDVWVESQKHRASALRAHAVLHITVAKPSSAFAESVDVGCLSNGTSVATQSIPA